MRDGVNQQAISRSVKTGRETVREYLERAAAAGYGSWDQIRDIDEAELERKLFPPGKKHQEDEGSKRVPDWKEVHKGLGRKGVTQRLL